MSLFGKKKNEVYAVQDWSDCSGRDWKVPLLGGQPQNSEDYIICILQDIRRELKQLNALFKDQPFVYYPKGDGK